MLGNRPVLLVVDDEPGILELMRKLGERVGYEVLTFISGHAALESLRVRRANVALVDLRMPDVNGLEVLRAVRDIDPECQIILMTGQASIDSAIEAVKMGALDFLTKPLDVGRLEQLLGGVRMQVEQRQHILASEAALAHWLEFFGLIGRSPVMQDLFSLIRRLAPHLQSGLITGETGTGKELVARALHKTGPRSKQPFTVINCSSPIESAFEGRPGVLEQANGGVILFDEVANLPLAAQARILRVLEYGELSRVGGVVQGRLDVVALASTNRDLRTEVAAGRFRSDLFYRLSAVEISLSPLRDRREDIPYLTSAFVRECATRLEKSISGLTTAAESILVSAPWEGNVRELKNVIERACLLAGDTLITEREIAASMPAGRGLPPVPEPAAAGERDLLSTVEREHILRALQRTGGNKKAAARMLGVSRRALYRRLERLDLGATISRRKDRENGNNHEASV